jgi:hypothetical protein
MLAAAETSAAACAVAESGSLDDVDLGRQIARDLEADFLLTHLRLVPNFHGVSSLSGEESTPSFPCAGIKGLRSLGNGILPNSAGVNLIVRSTLRSCEEKR